jgi:hypothetical protein
LIQRPWELHQVTPVRAGVFGQAGKFSETNESSGNPAGVGAGRKKIFVKV